MKLTSLPPLVEHPGELPRRTYTSQALEIKRPIAWGNSSIAEITLPDPDGGNEGPRLDSFERSASVLPLRSSGSTFKDLRKMDKQEQGLSDSSSVVRFPRSLSGDHQASGKATFTFLPRQASSQVENNGKKPGRNTKMALLAPAGTSTCGLIPRPSSARPGARSTQLRYGQGTGLRALGLQDSSSVGTLVPERKGLHLEANRALSSIKEGSVIQERVSEKQPARQVSILSIVLPEVPKQSAFTEK